jgi:hypothetical protein
MSIEMPALEVHALADGLRRGAAVADEAQHQLGAPIDVGGPLQPTVEAFLQSHRTAAQALAGELRWLGDTIAAVADSWLVLDDTLLSRVKRPGVV